MQPTRSAPANSQPWPPVPHQYHTGVKPRHHLDPHLICVRACVLDIEYLHRAGVYLHRHSLNSLNAHRLLVCTSLQVWTFRSGRQSGGHVPQCWHPHTTAHVQRHWRTHHLASGPCPDPDTLPTLVPTRPRRRAYLCDTCARMRSTTSAATALIPATSRRLGKLHPDHPDHPDHRPPAARRRRARPTRHPTQHNN